MPTSNNDRKWWPGEIITASKLNYIEDFLQNISGNFIPMSGTDTNGPYVRGNVTYVPDGVDMTQPNNGVTETIWPSVNRVNDTNGNIIGRFETQLNTSGDVEAIMYARNYDGSMNYTENKLRLIVHKNGTTEVGLNQTAWLTALGLAGEQSISNALYKTYSGEYQTIGSSLVVESGYQLRSAGINCSWFNGRKYALLKNETTGTSTQYIPTVSMATLDNDTWEIGTYGDKTLRFTYVPKNSYEGQNFNGIGYLSFDQTGLFNGTAKKTQKIITPNSGGYETDDYGNLKHRNEPSASTWSTDNTWNIQNIGGTNEFSVKFENGDTSTRGTLTIGNAENKESYIYLNSSRIASGTNQDLIVGILKLKDTTNNQTRAYLQYRSFSGGTQLVELGLHRVYDNSDPYNYIKLGLNKDKTYYIELPGVGGKSASTAVAAWRASLGLGSTAGALPILVSQGGTGKTSLDSGKVLIGNGTDSVVFKGILNLGTKGPTSYSSSNTNPDLVTTHTLAYWNGAYDSNGHSNISYVATISGGSWASTIAAGAKTTNNTGWKLDANGNFIHQNAGSSNYWAIKDSNSTDRFKVYFDNGNTAIAGTLTIGGLTASSNIIKILDGGNYYFQKRMSSTQFLITGTTTDDKFRGGIAIDSSNNRMYFRTHKTSGNALGDVFYLPIPTNTSTSADVKYDILTTKTLRVAHGTQSNGTVQGKHYVDVVVKFSDYGVSFTTTPDIIVGIAGTTNQTDTGLGSCSVMVVAKSTTQFTVRKFSNDSSNGNNSFGFSWTAIGN